MASDGSLKIEGLTAAYGRHRVLEGVDLDVPESQVVALLGHNGAGKTTLLRAVMGLETPTGGSVEYRGTRYGRESVATRAQQGLALVPDVSRGGIFGDMSVKDNLSLAEKVTQGDGPEVSPKLLEDLFPPIFEKQDQLARELSGGQRQMVAVAIALKRRPRMLLLDEPSVGLAPLLVKSMMEAISRITRELGIGALLVEQNVPAACAVADRVAVLKSGRILREYLPGEIPSTHELWELF